VCCSDAQPPRLRGFVRFFVIFHIPIVTFGGMCRAFCRERLKEIGGLISMGKAAIRPMPRPRFQKSTDHHPQSLWRAYDVIGFQKHLRGDVNYAGPSARSLSMVPRVLWNHAFRKDIAECGAYAEHTSEYEMTVFSVAVCLLRNGAYIE